MQYWRSIFLLFGLGLALTVSILAQGLPSALAAITDRQVATATSQLQQVKQLVGAGALPESRIREAELKLQDAQDEQILDRTLYGTVMVQDLSGEQAAEMVGAASRRLERQREKVERLRKLASDGVLALVEVAPFEGELRIRETALSLAQQRAQLFEEMAAAAQSEEIADTSNSPDAPLMEKFDGNGRFDEQKEWKPLAAAFEKKFEASIPVSANGETAVHRALGFDHRGRVDIALNPDTPQGLWLRQYLESRKIPYYAFRSAIPGKATGAHIHIGPSSTRWRNAD